ncbi:hypothetical protein PACTADRAFT_51964 [Pachysolen tannophilus NRRL Y-2460]|uniref:Major facilitator superfamily (MFS) profile domain-containing protein n=1 Tax=Pachysolen tannophilus NRRL Y-2460 TaxID=669874 RepID=A0A1E4TNN4_PACTA|nr:hypothetical protein PACTADRAFT_51964 [Pachysolen tannophilus NRRL Y-2460]
MEEQKDYQAGTFTINMVNSDFSGDDDIVVPVKTSDESIINRDTVLKPKDDEDNTSMLMTFHDSKPSVLVVVLTFVASISGFMFGYDTGYISSALVAIGTDFGKTLTYGEKELITSATSLGALISSIIAGLSADIVGRRPVIMSSNILFIVGSAIQCGAHSLWVMIGGRFVMGFGVGIGSLVAPLYISELAPTKYRGRLVIINCLAITGGQLIAYAIGAGLTQVNNGWRILVGLSIIPPLVQLVTFFFLPDTPRFLISKGKIDEAEKVLKKTYNSASDDLIKTKIEELNNLNKILPGNNPLQKTWNGIKEIHRVPSNFRGLIIACGLQGIQQFTGWNSLMYFSSTIFEAIGFQDSTAVSIIIAGTNFIFTIVAFFVIDRVGRRRILLIGIPGMIIMLVLCSISFHFIDITFSGSTAVIDNSDGSVSGWGIVVIVAMICFAASYAVGIGNVPWQQSELFPQSVRAVGASYATATNWAGSLVIASTFLTMLQNITPTGTFALFAAIGVVSLVFVIFCYPELSNLELEEVQQVLTGGFNIVASQKLAKAQRLSSKEIDVEKKSTGEAFIKV